MAPPRFAATGRRARVPVPVGTRARVGSTAAAGTRAVVGGSRALLPPSPAQRSPRAVVQSAQQKAGSYYQQLGQQLGQEVGDPNDLLYGAPTSKSFRKDPVGMLRDMGLTDEEIEVVMPLAQMAATRERPTTALDIAGKALGAPEAVVAGFTKGITDPEFGGDIGLIDLIKDPDKGKKLTPWAGINALGKGFTEIPDSVEEGYTFENLLKERNNPDSFLYRHSMPVGLTLSIFADPTTYLSFGMTTPTKIAGRRLLAEGGREAAREASKRIAKKEINRATGKPYQEHEYLEAVEHAMVDLNKPHTLGDAVKIVRERELAIRAEARGGRGRAARIEAIRRAGEPEYAAKLERRRVRGAISNRLQQATAVVAPYNVKGGAGVRFAGQEIPGTAALGARLARGARGVSKEATESTVVGGAAAGIVPNASARHIASDWIRAGAGAEISTLKEAVQQSGSALDEEFEQLIKGVPQGAAKPVDELLDLDARRNILKPAPYTWQTADQKLVAQHLLQQVENAKVKHLGRTGAKKVDLDTKWLDIQERFDDPVEAAARFVTDLELTHLKRTHITRILEDPRFAYKLPKVQPGQKRATHIREGFERHKYGNKWYAVHTPIKQALDQFENPKVMNANLNKFLKAVNAPQNWWKIFATVPNPSFHLMNFLGAVWNNLLMGIYNPGDTVHALGTLYRSRLEQAAQAGEISWAAPLRAARGEAPVSTPLTQESARIVEEAGARGGLGRSSFIWAETEALAREERRAGTPAGATPRERAMAATQKAVGRPGAAEKGLPLAKGAKGRAARKTARRGRQLAAVGAAPFTGGISLVGLAPEAAQAGRRVGGAIEDMVRLTAFQKAAKDPGVQQALEAFGPIRVPGFVKAGTHPGFTKREQQIMYDIGADMAKHFQFDYTDLTDVERYLAKTIFPFYTYYRKNFVLQATELVKQPRKVATAEAVMNYIGEQGEYGDMPEEFQALLPEYFDNLNAFQIPVPGPMRKMLGLPQDQPLYLNPKLPFVSLNLFPPLWQMFQDSDTPTWQKLGAVMAPTLGMVGPYAGGLPFKVALEALVGYQAGLNRPIDFQRASSNDWRTGYVPAPGWMKYLPMELIGWTGVVNDKHGRRMMPATNKYIAEQMTGPFMTNFGSAIPVETGDPESEAKAKADLFSWMTGVRLMPADMSRLSKNYAYRLKNMLEARKSDLEFQGKELDEEDEDILELVKDAVEVAEEVEEDRIEELYPEEEK